MKRFKKLVIIMFILISNYIISQTEIQNGTYISTNNLESIFIMNNHTFGYLSYSNDSPYIDKKKEKKRKSYILNASGSGKYTIENDTLKLKFLEKKSIIDSVKISYFTTEKINDSVNIKILPFYNYKIIGMPEIEIRDKNGIFLMTSSFNSNLSMNIEKSKFPFNLVINDTEIIELKEPFNCLIYLYANCFINHNVSFQKEKTFAIKTLIYDTEN